jgi:hypothetical protein
VDALRLCRLQLVMLSCAFILTKTAALMACSWYSVVCCYPSPQGYDACTWESEACAALLQPEHVALHLALWDRQHRALARAGEEARRKERAAAAAAERSLPLVSRTCCCQHACSCSASVILAERRTCVIACHACAPSTCIVCLLSAL